MVSFVMLGLSGQEEATLPLLVEAGRHLLSGHLQACVKHLGADALHVSWGKLNLIAGQLAKSSVGLAVGTSFARWAIL